MTIEGWQIIATYGSIWDCELDAGRLEDAGIPNLIDRRGAVGITGPGLAGGTSLFGVTLLVPDEHADEARRILGDGGTSASPPP